MIKTDRRPSLISRAKITLDVFEDVQEKFLLKFNKKILGDTQKPELIKGRISKIKIKGQICKDKQKGETIINFPKIKGQFF